MELAVEAEQVKLSEEQAVEAIKSYCFSLNQDLEQIVNDGVYQVHWTVVSCDDNEIVVLYRSYTGSHKIDENNEKKDPGLPEGK